MEVSLGDSGCAVASLEERRRIGQSNWLGRGGHCKYLVKAVLELG